MTSPEGVERRRGITASEVAQSLIFHEQKCAEQYEAVLKELREFRAETKPMVEVWNAGGVAVKFIKLTLLIATTITAVVAVIKFWPRGV